MGLASRINSPFRPLTHARDRFLELQKAMHTEYQPTLTALVELFEALNAQGIRYCHWKSNYHLEQSLSGLTDLDLLVDPVHEERFRLILHQQDVKPIISPPGKRYPGVEDYLGFDPVTGQLFHLHVHYQLILGEQFVKNYRLPLEKAFLDNVYLYKGLIKIPYPELELIVLAVRALLKYRDRDIVKDIFSIRSSGLPLEILREFKYLLDQTDPETISNALQSHAKFVRPEIVHELLRTVVSSPRSGYLLYRLRRDLRRDLSAYQRHNRWSARRKYFGELLRRRLSFLGVRSSKKTPMTGGIAIALIGADGAGKSTVVKELCKWLSWKLKVRRYHMGSQQPSRISRSLHVVFRMDRKAHRLWSGFVGEEHISSRGLLWLQRLLYNLYSVSVGRDRYRRYMAGTLQAAKGCVVLYDRYPLAAIHRVMDGRPMDGPRITVDAEHRMDGITRALSRLEQNIYRKIHPPDCTFALHVSPEVSQQRKPDHELEMIEAKSRAIKQMDVQGLRSVEIDADQPLEQVLLQIKTTLWQLL
jgi:thymidylate kinase